MCHAGTADSFDQGFLDDAVFYIEGEFASALLRGAPANAMGEPADISYLSGLSPCTFLWDRGRTMICPLSHAAHFLNFRRVLHSFLLGKFLVKLLITGSKGGTLEYLSHPTMMTGNLFLWLVYYSKIVTNYKSRELWQVILIRWKDRIRIGLKLQFGETVKE